MKLIDDLRRENLAQLRADAGGLNKLSSLLDRDDSQVSQWLNGLKNSGTGKPRGMRSNTARYIEEKCKKPQGWLDQDHSAEAGDQTIQIKTHALSIVDRVQTSVTFADAVRIIAERLMDVDESTSAMAMTVLGHLAQQPEEYEKISRAVLAVLESGKRRRA